MRVFGINPVSADGTTLVARYYGGSPTANGTLILTESDSDVGLACLQAIRFILSRELPNAVPPMHEESIELIIPEPNLRDRLLKGDLSTHHHASYLNSFVKAKISAGEEHERICQILAASQEQGQTVTVSTRPLPTLGVIDSESMGEIAFTKGAIARFERTVEHAKNLSGGDTLKILRKACQKPDNFRLSTLLEDMESTRERFGENDAIEYWCIPSFNMRFVIARSESGVGTLIDVTRIPVPKGAHPSNAALILKACQSYIDLCSPEQLEYMQPSTGIASYGER